MPRCEQRLLGPFLGGTQWWWRKPNPGIPHWKVCQLIIFELKPSFYSGNSTKEPCGLRFLAGVWLARRSGCSAMPSLWKAAGAQCWALLRDRRTSSASRLSTRLASATLQRPVTPSQPTMPAGTREWQVGTEPRTICSLRTTGGCRNNRVQIVQILPIPTNAFSEPILGALWTEKAQYTIVCDIKCL